MKVFLDMVGCRLNQSELENYAQQFRGAGHTLTPDAASADLIVINTCTVTSAAASDSRQKIRQASQSRAGQIIVTGCWASLNPQEAGNFPRVTQVIANQQKDDLVSLVLKLPLDSDDRSRIHRVPIPGSRMRTRAFIKVQDGCDNHCTYCITRLARGPGRSREIKAVMQDIQAALNGGTQEIILTGVHLGSWGYDFGHPLHLRHLISSILADTDTPRLRLSSIEPWDISPGFFSLWQDKRLCPHLHLPLQSGSAATLKRMGRHGSPESFSDLIGQARRFIPDVAITTDIITGFPGETDLEFTESMSFVNEMDFAAGHVFTYSPRPGTAAAMLPAQVPHVISKERNALMRELFHQSAIKYREKQLGQILQVLWEKAVPVGENQWNLSGLSSNYLRVKAKNSTPCRNQLMSVVIIGLEHGDLVGEISAT